MGEENVSAVTAGGTRRAVKLRCAVQNYEWGLRGEASEVGRLFALQSEAEFNHAKPYAELWMGTHSSAPSFVTDLHHHHHHHDKDGEEESGVLPLKDWLSLNPDALGDKVLKRWGPDLPFLFKVLSIANALSIQAHPDKILADRLHRLQPNIYKDSNHKPEMALALTDFEALCGFVSPQELEQVVRTVPELLSILGESASNSLVESPVRLQGNEEEAKAILRVAFTNIMTANQTVIADALSKLVLRLTEEQQVRELTLKEKLILRLQKQYPGDVGVLSAFFFNYICLVKGEALYLDANEPHAYISGECLECMATSDNVVRAGLTPKYRDTETLCSMLSYKQEAPEILRGVEVNSYTKRYAPPFDEFEVDYSVIPEGAEAVVIPAISGPSLVLVLEGEGLMGQAFGGEQSATELTRRGDIFFIPAGVELDLKATHGRNGTTIPKEDGKGGLHVYRAGVSTRVLQD